MTQQHARQQTPVTKVQSAVEAQGLVKHYGNTAKNVLQGVSLTVQQGEFVALMGASGCGKSTLLNILGGIDRPSSGQLKILGEPIEKKSDSELTVLRRKTLGFIFQFFNLMTTLTARENVALPLELSGIGSSKVQNERVISILEQVGMGHRLNFYPAQLSGGEMQRIAIARALIHQPQIIIADEPTGNLDTENGQTVLNLLTTLATQNGQTVVMATHSHEAASYANRILRMKDGQIQE